MVRIYTMNIMVLRGMIPLSRVIESCEFFLNDSLIGELFGYELQLGIPIFAETADEGFLEELVDGKVLLLSLEHSHFAYVPAVVVEGTVGTILAHTDGVEVARYGLVEGYPSLAVGTLDGAVAAAPLVVAGENAEWSLAENGFLRYQFLQKFDREMIHLVDENKIFNNKPVSLYQDELQKLLIFERGCLIFAFNFHPSQSVTNFRFSAPKGKYRLILDTDGLDYNGFGRNDASVTHSTIEEYGDSKLSLYLPNRSAIVLKKIK